MILDRRGEETSAPAQAQQHQDGIDATLDRLSGVESKVAALTARVVGRFEAELAKSRIVHLSDVAALTEPRDRLEAKLR